MNYSNKENKKLLIAEGVASISDSLQEVDPWTARKEETTTEDVVKNEVI
jgi:hypothetical protein